MEAPKLIFVYNANSGKLNGMMDVAHKILSPKTYQCSLCAVTHGAFKERDSWKAFRQRSKINMEFLHIDEFEDRYKSKFGHSFSYPVVLIQDHTNLDVFLSTDTIDDLPSTEALITLIESKTPGY